MATAALELERSGLSHQRIPPDYRFPYGHTHNKQEEAYVVVGGSGRMKLDDEIVGVGKWDVVRVAPGTWLDRGTVLPWWRIRPPRQDGDRAGRTGRGWLVRVAPPYRPRRASTPAAACSPERTAPSM